MNDREAWIILNAMKKVGPVRVRALIERLGSPAAIFEAGERDLRAAPGVGPEAASSILRWREESIDPAAEEAAAARLGIRIVVRDEEDYPPLLREIHDPPLALYVRGTIAPEDRHAVAVVGCRGATHYGRSMAERIASELARCGICVVSGLARGIDTAAHRGALRASGRTLAVVGCGLDICYPAENRDLADRIAGSGAILSEFPLGTAPERSNFPMRNRIISGLSMGVVVVEAGDRSGALITADEALAQGRSVLAVPGRIDSPKSRGTHRLLKEGARLVDCVDDILDEFGWLFRGAAAARGGAPAPAPSLAPEEEAVYACTGRDPVGIDEIIRRSGLNSGKVSSILLRLEMRRVVRQLPGKRFVRRVPSDEDGPGG